MSVEENETLDNDPERLREYVEKNRWKIRDYEDYMNEYNSCGSLKGKFHQYFVFGETIDCSSWKEDLENCKKPDDDFKAKLSIIRHEEERQRQRLSAHFANNVWKRRETPPANWNCELPESFQQNIENSFKIANDSPSSCTIF